MLTAVTISWYIFLEKEFHIQKEKNAVELQNAGDHSLPNYLF
jgi:hypothetical protein